MLPVSLTARDLLEGPSHLSAALRLVPCAPSLPLRCIKAYRAAGPLVLAPPCGHGENSPIFRQRLLGPLRFVRVSCSLQRSPPRFLPRRSWQPEASAATAFLKGSGWGGSTHCVGLGAGRLAPEVGGNDCDEELQDGEDGKHSQIAPAHVLGTQSHS